MEYVIRIFSMHKWRIILIYFICAIANLLYLLEPAVLGKMIDGILAREYNYVIYFVILRLNLIAFGYIRRYYDTIVFSKIYNQTVIHFIEEKMNDSYDPSSINARVEMAKKVIHFFEDEIPQFITDLYGAIGSIVIIYTLNKLSAIVFLLFIMPAYFITKYFYAKSRKVNRVRNMNSEKQVSKIQSYDINEITNYFNRQRRIKIMESTISARNIGAFEIFSLLFTILSMITYGLTVNFTAGEALAFYGYSLKFTNSLNYIPFTVDMYANLKDIVRRLT